MCSHTIRSRLNDIMFELSRDHGDFGLTFAGERQKERLEREFQELMHTKLQQSENGWQWEREAPLVTTCLINEQEVLIDIIGLHDRHGIVAIELKYVTATHCINCKHSHKPSNEPAFAYDVAKDCLKIELLMKGLAKPRTASHLARYRQDHPSTPVYGYIIALTSWPGYWGNEGTRQPDDWAKNFRRKVSQRRVCLEGQIESGGRNPRKTIYGSGGERCHISLAMPWSGEWTIYREFPDANLQFQYLLLAPTSEVQAEYTHDAGASDIIPFLDPAAKEMYRSIARDVRQGR